MTELLKADFHIHTVYSMDCTTSLEDIIKRCLETGINCIAVTDHDAIEGAFEMEKLAPFPVIIAQEILTPQGEVIGMFLKEGVPFGLPIEEAISRIKAQGALAWIWARSGRTIPIPGIRTVAQAEENAKAMTFGPLRAEQLREIERLLGR